jgi:hypothetical protein
MARNSLDERRIVRRISQCAPKFLDSSVETIVEINKRVGWPDLSAKLLTGYNFSRPLQQEGQNPERLVLNVDRHAAFVKFKR